jgi:hypothetical protein
MVDAPTAFSIFPLTLGMALSQARSLAVSGGGAVVVGAKVVGATVLVVAWAAVLDSSGWPRTHRPAAQAGS